MIQKLFIDNTSNTIIQWFRYTLAGVIIVSVDLYLFYTFVETFRVNYFIAASMTFLVGILLNYLFCVNWIFKRNYGNLSREIVIMIITGLISLVILESIMGILCELFLFHYLLSKVIATFAASMFNFLSRKILIFNN